MLAKIDRTSLKKKFQESSRTCKQRDERQTRGLEKFREKDCC